MGMAIYQPVLWDGIEVFLHIDWGRSSSLLSMLVLVGGVDFYSLFGITIPQ